jgi:hypothetical protein
MHIRHLRAFSTIALSLVAVAGRAADTPPADGKPVCRSEKNTGSRIATSECHTRAEWVEIDARRAKQAEQFQRGLNNPAADRPISNSPYPR